MPDRNRRPGFHRGACFLISADSLLRLEYGLHALIGLVAVQLGHRLKGRVHGQDRHARVQRGDVPVGHIHGHSAAAAGVHLAQLCDLPDDPRLVKEVGLWTWLDLGTF